MDWLDTSGMDLSVVGLVSGGHFLSHFYLLTFPPLFPILQGEFGLSNVELGLIMSAIQVGTFLQVFAGDVVDRVGGKRVFVLGIVVTAAGIGLAGIAGSYVMIVVFALVSSLGQAAFHPSDYALLDAASAEGGSGKSFALHSFAGSLGFAAAPVVVWGLALVAGWQLTLVAVGALGMGYALFAYLLMDEVYLPTIDEAVEEEAADRDVRWTNVLDPTLIALFGFVFLTVFGIIGIQTFTPVLAADGFQLGEATGSTALTAFFTVFALAVLVGGVIADRLPPHYVIVPGIAASAALIWAVAAGAVPAVPAAVIVVFALIGGCSGLFLPSRDRLINAASPRGSTGRSFGFVLTGISLAGVVAPALLGAVIDATTVWTAYWMIGASIGLGGVIALAIASGRIDRIGSRADAA